mgnify:CR=1 FL=1
MTASALGQAQFRDDKTGKVKIDYRPVHDYTMTNEIAPFPPKARV